MISDPQKTLFHSVKKRIGFVFSLLILVSCTVWYSLKAGLIFAVLILVLSSITLKIEKPAVSTVLNVLWGIACIFFTNYSSREFMNIHFPQQGLIQFMSAHLLIAAIFLILYSFTLRFKPTIILGSGIFVGFTMMCDSK